MDKKDPLSLQSLMTEVELNAEEELSDDEAFDRALKLRAQKLKELKAASQ